MRDLRKWKRNILRVGAPLFLAAGIPAAQYAWSDFFNQSVREASRQYVQDCAAKVDVGDSVPVQYSWKQLCSKTPGSGRPDYLGDSTDYVLTREEDRGPQDRDSAASGDSGAERRVSVAATVPLQMWTPAELKWETTDPKKRTPKRPKGLSTDQRAQIVARTQACMPAINRYWDHYGVELKLTFADASQARANANSVWVIYGQGRSNSKMFYFGGLDNEVPVPKLPPPMDLLLKDIKVPAGFTRQCLKAACGDDIGKLLGNDPACACEEARQREYCNMMAHELGHRLGLPDEYADPAYCPDRPSVSNESFPYSMMAAPQPGILDDMLPAAFRPPGDHTLEEFYPRSVKRVVGPLCGETPETELK